MSLDDLLPLLVVGFALLSVVRRAIGSRRPGSPPRSPPTRAPQAQPRTQGRTTVAPPPTATPTATLTPDRAFEAKLEEARRRVQQAQAQTDGRQPSRPTERSGRRSEGRGRNRSAPAAPAAAQIGSESAGGFFASGSAASPYTFLPSESRTAVSQLEVSQPLQVRRSARAKRATLAPGALGFGQSELLRQKRRAKVVARGDEVRLKGSDPHVAEAAQTFRALLASIRRGEELSLTELEHSPLGELAEEARSDDPPGAPGSDALERLPKRARPKTAGQRRYVQAIAESPVTFGIGPAGTGKTYLAVAMAVLALKDKRVKRIILTRPAVEAGERLGFLPGDLQAKIDPYLRPLYDALYDMLEGERIEGYLENGTIEVAPLAFMRGRTLNDAFIILDEAQNTTPEQMKMFLTRMGFNSKVVVTGDVTQIDLPSSVKSGLNVAERILNDIEGLSFIYFNEGDVVRHPLVARIIKAYDQGQV